MEENKDKKCCENGSCENCKDKKGGCCCCCHCCRHGGRGRILRIILYIIVFGIIINLVFSLFGFGRGFRERGEFRPLMNYSYGPKVDLNSTTGSTTVKVLPNTTTPPVTQ